MNKKVLFFLLLGMLAFVCTVFAQADSTVTEDPTPTNVLEWIAYVISAISLVLTPWLNSKRVKLAKAIPVLQALIYALEGNKSSVSPTTIKAMQDGKKIIEKEE